jgi:hypothetical protein
VVLGEQGNLAGARELQEHELEESRRVQGEEHPQTLTAMSNLAATLYLQCDLKGARELQEQVLEESRRVQGEEHSHTLTAMNNLAATLKGLGDLVATRKLQEQVLETRRRLLGEEHPDTLTAMTSLAGTLCSQRDLVGARELQERALEACVRGSSAIRKYPFLHSRQPHKNAAKLGSCPKIADSKTYQEGPIENQVREALNSRS